MTVQIVFQDKANSLGGKQLKICSRENELVRVPGLKENYVYRDS